jgi:DNA invertase Pin-like site-specific DNA recombinase
MNTPCPHFLVHFGWFPGEWTAHVNGTPKMNSSSARIGYARVSTADQNLDAQTAALQAAGCTMVRTETGDGATLAGRPELGTILEFIHPGETLVVTRIDRLARSMRDLQIIVATLKDKGAHLAATEQPVDTSTAAGKAFFDMLGVFAEFETNLRRERQAEGVAAAKQRGAYRDRLPRIDMEGIKYRPAMGLSPTDVARELRVSRGTVYKARAGMTDIA